MLDLPLIVPAIRLDKDDGGEEERALRRAAEPWVAGFLLFGGDVRQVTRLTTRLRRAAGRPIFIASDMERGAGQQVEGLSILPGAGMIGLAGTPRDAFKIGEWTALEARSVGIDVILGPCVDVRSTLANPILGNRSFGFNPMRVGDLARMFGYGIEAGGALAVLKHWPGHGATTEDSHDAVPVVHDAEAVIEERDLLPYRSVLGANIASALMAAHVAYPALDPSGTIATFSAPILKRARALAATTGRVDIPVFTDALIMAGAQVEGGEAEAARRALTAGCDLLLYPEDPEALAAALGQGDGVPQAALVRARENSAWFAEAAVGLHRRAVFTGTDAALHARRLAERVCAMSGVIDAGLGVHGIVVIDDDDIEDRGAVLVRLAHERGLVAERVRVPRGEVPALPPIEVESPACAQRAIVVFASARAWKGTSGVSDACRRLVAETDRRIEENEELATTVWCTPRAETSLAPHVPGTGPHLEAALARYLFPDDDALSDIHGGLLGEM